MREHPGPQLGVLSGKLSGFAECALGRSCLHAGDVVPDDRDWVLAISRCAHGCRHVGV